ncbi:hypothetical protein JHK86_031882 [Glycine max]|nr:hypothetical protein JHK86_031882 [Glycine max]
MATVQYALCSAAKENKVKAVSARVMKVLVELMVDLGLSMVYLVSVVMAVVEERVALRWEFKTPSRLREEKSPSHWQRFAPPEHLSSYSVWNLRTYFNAPRGNEPLALDMESMV